MYVKLTKFEWQWLTICHIISKTTAGKVTLMSTTVDASLMRHVNKRTVLGLLYQEKAISRSDISRTTGLNRATVSSLVDELIADQFVVEVGTGRSSGGRRPIILQFNTETGYVIGVDVQITHVTTVLANAGREVVFQHRRNIDAMAAPLDESALTRLIAEEIAVVKRVCPPSPHGLMGVGVGLPGLVDHQRGKAIYLPNLGITDWNVRDSLAAFESLPIFVDNDANCGAWSEYLSTRVPHLIFVNAGIGVGAGIIINGHLYRGAGGLAGEAGHHAISPTGDDCHCGNIGCWEQYASERAIQHSLAAAGALMPDILPSDFVDQCVREADAGNPIYLAAFETLAQHLGVGLVNLLNLFNPTAVFLSGTLAEAYHLMQPTLASIVETRAMFMNRHIPVTPASSISVALGAAGLALAQSIALLPTVL